MYRQTNVCGKCGFSHSRLGVRIEGSTLFRSSADPKRHMIHKDGGAWAFESALLSKHPEVNYIIITATTGEVWQVDRRTFDERAYRETSSGRPQFALSLIHWKKEGEPERTEPNAEAVQPFLLSVSPPSGTFYEKAKKPRPRLDPKRPRWSGREA
jgi:hypothetical protein